MKRSRLPGLCTTVPRTRAREKQPSTFKCTKKYKDINISENNKIQKKKVNINNFNRAYVENPNIVNYTNNNNNLKYDEEFSTDFIKFIPDNLK